MAGKADAPLSDWYLVANELTARELSCAVDRHEDDIRDIRRDYLPREVFMSMHNAVLERINRLEQDDSTKKAANRNALLALAGTVVGIFVSAIVTLAISRGVH